MFRWMGGEFDGVTSSKDQADDLIGCGDTRVEITILMAVDS